MVTVAKYYGYSFTTCIKCQKLMFLGQFNSRISFYNKINSLFLEQKLINVMQCILYFYNSKTETSM